MSDGRRRDGDEGGPAVRRSGPPLGLLGMLALVLAIESGLVRRDLDFTAPWHWDWRTTGKVAAHRGWLGGRNVLIFGDSLAKFGLMPRAIDRASGRSAYNLAIHTGQASTSYFLLKRALDAGARPSAIVFELTPHMLMHAPGENRELWADLLSTRETLDMARTMGDADFFAATTLGRVLPSYKARSAIRSEAIAALGGLTRSRRALVLACRRNWKINQGAQLMTAGPSPTLVLDVWEKTLYSKWRPDPVNLAYLGRFLDLAESRKIPVYWLLPPIHPEVQARVDASGFDASYSGFVREYQARYPGVVVVDARHSGFEAGWFVDGIHVNRRGALRLSAGIGELLGSPASGRWLAAKAGPDRPVDLPIEDVSESETAIARSGAGDRQTR